MKNKNLLILASVASAVCMSGMATAQTASNATSAGSATPTADQQTTLIKVDQQPKTRAQVKAEIRQVRESNTLLIGESSPVNDVLSRPYGVQPVYGNQTSVGEPAPGSTRSGQ